MATYRYPNLTIVEEDACIRFRMQQLCHAIIARFPHHESPDITAEAIQAAVHNQLGASIRLHDISRYASGFLLEIHSAATRSLMLTRGYLAMVPFSLNLMPWNPEYGSFAVLAYPQLATLSNFDHSAFARRSHRPLRHIQIQISGIPPQLCSNATVSTLLNRVAKVRQITLNPSNHRYLVHAETHCPDAIPPTANIGIRRMQEDKLLFNIWPIWYNSVGITASNDDGLNHAHPQGSNRLGDLKPRTHISARNIELQYKLSNFFPFFFTIPNNQAI